jgi:cyclohexanone monooxygenase
MHPNATGRPIAGGTAMASRASTLARCDYDVLIVGAGFAGMYMLIQCRRLGLKARVLEAGPAVGGTWYWNRYPGLRCDVESMQYSYSFDPELQQEWDWPERYSAQPDILRYANHVADRYDLRRDIDFDARVSQARYDASAGHWEVTARRIGTRTARFVVMATGCLSVPKDVDIPGVADFRGEVYHTARWPERPVDFTGKRVGVIGTGSSGIQVIPILAQQAAHLTVFQRTPSYTLPAKNRALTPADREAVRSRYDAVRAEARAHRVGIPSPMVAASAFDVSDAERRRVYDQCYDHGLPFAMMVAFGDTLVDERSNRTVQAYLEQRLRARIQDPALAERLIPKGQYVGSRRMCIDTDYYETFNRPDVSLRDLRENPIERITAGGVQLRDGFESLDCLVFATGYDAITGALLAMDIRGRDGVSLRECWAQGARTMMGLMVAGFPNLFTVTGPGSPSVFSNVLVSIEQHVEWIARCLRHMAKKGLATIEATVEAQDKWVDHVDEVANATLVPRGDAWYGGGNVPGKPRVFTPYLGGVGTYRKLCDEVAAAGYPGFAFA